MSTKLAPMIGIQCVGLHQGQRTYVPHRKAGHMTAADQIVQREENACHGAVHICSAGKSKSVSSASRSFSRQSTALSYFGAYFSANVAMAKFAAARFGDNGIRADLYERWAARTSAVCGERSRSCAASSVEHIGGHSHTRPPNSLDFRGAPRRTNGACRLHCSRSRASGSRMMRFEFMRRE